MVDESVEVEPAASQTLPAGVVAPAVSLLPTLDVPVRGSRPDASDADLPQIAGFETLRVLGRGGMGVVYLAWQTQLARLVALKMVLAGSHAGQEQRARFHTEAEAVARLQHPNIVQIFEVGEADGQPYLAMEYVEGGSLATVLQGKPQPWQAVATLVSLLAQAIHHAHRRGIVHRDLKPANILMHLPGGDGLRESKDPSRGEFGIPKVTDFGLAKLVVGGLSQTVTGAILGTPGYMAPEQAAATTNPVGPAADIHALGAILYELLTGRPPFQAASVLETLEQVRSQEPVSPRHLVPTIPRDLETICLKCLQKEPTRRYKSAEALAQDLRRCIEGEPIQARPVGVWERGLKWLRRHPARAALVGVSCLTALALTWVAVSLSYSARLEAVNEALEVARAEAERQRAGLALLERRVRYVRDVHLASEAWHNGQLRRLLPLLEGCPADLRGWEWYYLHVLSRKGGRSLMHQAGVLAVSFNPDGRHLASGCADGAVYFWDRVTGHGFPAREHHKGGVWGVAFRSDGQLVASAGEDHLVRLWSPTSGRLVRILRGHQAAVRCVAFSPDGKTLASAGKDQTIKIWDPDTGRELRTLRGHTGWILNVAFAPDSRRLASGSADRTLRLWDPDRGVEVRVLEGHTDSVHGVAFSVDGTVLASSGGDGTLRTWDPANGRPLAIYHPGRATTFYSVAVSPQGHLATATEDREIRCWVGSLLQTFRGHNHRVQSVAFSPDGHYLASASMDWTVKLWEVGAGQEFQALPMHSGPVLGAHFTPEGGYLAAAARDGTVWVWDVSKDKLHRRLAVPLNHIRSVAFTPDGRLLAATGKKGTSLWDLSTGKAVSTLGHQGIPGRAVVFSPDGRRLAMTSDDSTVQVWDIADNRLLFTCKGHTIPVSAVAFSPDGQTLASGGRDQVRLWDTQTGKERPSLAEPTPRVVALAFSADGRLALAQMGGNITLWDPHRGQRLAALTGHSAMAWSVVFSPDGRRLVSASRDMTVKLWDTTSGQEVLTLQGFSAEVSGVAFSPDGLRLVTTDLSGSVRLWEADSSEEQSVARK